MGKKGPGIVGGMIVQEIFVTLRPRSALRMGRVKATGAYLDTLQYLPGSVLRGALAEWLILNGKAKEILPTIRRMRFGNLFPSLTDGVYALPFPLTALECKVKPGFKEAPRDKPREKGHGVRDTLLLALAYSEMERMFDFRFSVPMVLRCRECGGRMERASGFYAHLPEGWVKVRVKTAMQTKVALSRHRRASQEGMLYRVIAIRLEEVSFVGRLWVEEEKDLELLMEAVSNVGVGSLTTRGFGRAELKETEASLPSVRERVEKFNQKLKEVWEGLADLASQVGFNVPGEPKHTYFSLDFLSPAILRDAGGLPTLKFEISRKEGRLAPVFWVTQPFFVSGWSTAWGLPKPSALAAGMGSVYVYKVEGSLEEIVPKLEELEASGATEDRAEEGLGEILICHPFHLEVMPV